MNIHPVNVCAKNYSNRVERNLSHSIKSHNRVEFTYLRKEIEARVAVENFMGNLINNFGIETKLDVFGSVPQNVSTFLNSIMAFDYFGI